MWNCRLLSSARRARGAPRSAGAHARGDRASRPGRQRRLRRRRCRAGARAPQHHRRGRRPAADVQRGRHRLDHLQRRGFQLRRAARRADRARAHLQDQLRHRGHRPPLRGARARLRSGAQRRLRVRHLGCAPPAPGAGARPCRRAPALLCGARRRRCVCLRGEGAARGAGHQRRARPDRARPDVHVLVSAGAAYPVQGHRRAAAGACARRRRAMA